MEQTEHSHAEAAHHNHAAAADHQDHAQDHPVVFPSPSGDTEEFEEIKNNDLAAKAATIAVVGVGAALISAELIPGMIIGVCAAFLPGIGPKLRPFFKSSVRAGYKAVKKTREMVSEAGEQIQDMMAEAKHEKVPPVPVPPVPHTPANA